MTLVRWHRARNMHAIQHELSRLVNEFFRGDMQDKGARKQGSWTPAVDMHEGDEAFTLTAELPGFSKDDVQVEIKGNRLTRRGAQARDGCAEDTISPGGAGLWCF